MVLEPGMEAPSFELRDGRGKPWRLEELRGRKVILFFYPADDTPGCTIEACDFRDSHEEFRRAGFVVLGVSPQGAESHNAFSEKFGLNFPLLVDENAELAKSYGVFEERGDWDGIPLLLRRSTFVIDEEGKVEHALYGVHAKGHVDLLKESVGARA